MYDFKTVEEESRKIWQKNEKKIVKAIHNDPKKPLFSFLEGPPTANAPPALHHLEVRTFKDIICKFKYMNGFSVPRKGGWDCHGLPVEVQVEKQLGLNSKKDIAVYGIDKFIKKARESVFSNISDWEKSTKELGYWIDLKEPYVTLDNNYIESVWWSLKEMYKKGFLYEGYKVVPFCPRCGTPLSSHEVALGYKDVKDESVYIAFKLKNKTNSYILAWTTTAWTLPGNVALAVGPKIKYVNVKLHDGDSLIIGKDKLNVLKGDYKIIEEFDGKKLEGLEYEPLYDIKELQNKNSHKVILADFVTTEDGTGVVHTAVMYGEDDYNIGLAKNLPAVHTVGEDGKFLPIVKQFYGKFVKSAEKDIIEDLRARHLLFKKETITHSYPFCWRCDSPLLYYAINSWFISVSKVREKMVELNKDINWYPDHIKDGRFGKWLGGAKDWALSRSKFWGTPLPVWKNIKDKNDIIIIGSKEELEKLSGKKIKDLHKPDIDEIVIKKNGKEYRRVSDVIDCWYDSGSASFAQFHYPFENKKEFEKRFPYEFISEAIDQTRGWFYTLHVISTILFDKPAYKNVICAGHIVDENGEKMSKSKGNIIKPNEIIEKSGVDAVRLQFCTSDPGNQKRFYFELMKESVIPFLTVFYNSLSYYKQIDNKKNKKQIEDLWILSRLNSVILESTKELDNYSIDNAFRIISDFVVNDFSRSYIKMTREREDIKEIVGEVLEKTSLLIAPFAPYISEFIYKEFSKDSVHLSSWPKSNEKAIDLKLEEEFVEVLKIIEAGLFERDKIKIGLKWPLGKAIVYGKKKISKESIGIINEQLNVKEVEFILGEEINIAYDLKMTPDLESEGYARNISRSVQALRKKIGLVKSDNIELVVILDKNLLNLIKRQERFIKDRTNSIKITLSDRSDKLSGFADDKIEIKNNLINIYIKKVK
ncbi:MAG: isoleucine--tRNA ligase [Nanoarchaeota archaeon]